MRISMARSNKDSVPLRRLALNLKAIVAKQKEEWKTCESNVNAASESSDSDFVSIEDRENTCRWLLDVAESLKMSPDTVALCFGVFDRVLNVLKVRTRLVRVLAAACLSLTAKYTEDEARESFARSLCTAAGFTFSRKDLLRMELLVCTKLDWQINQSTSIDFLYAFMDIVGNGPDFPSQQKRITIAEFLCSRLVDWKLAKLPSMEVALGCLTVTFGGTGMLRLRRLLALHGYATNTHLIVETQRLLKPYAKMELKLISRLIQRGEEDETEADIFSSVKKLLNHGQLEPIPFGQMTFAEIVRC